MRTNDVVTIQQRATFIGASNKVIAELIKDETGMRRFAGITYRSDADWEYLNGLDWLSAWQSIAVEDVDPMDEFRAELSALQAFSRHVSPVEAWLTQLSRTTASCAPGNGDHIAPIDLYNDYLSHFHEHNDGQRAKGFHAWEQELGRLLKARPDTHDIEKHRTEGWQRMALAHTTFDRRRSACGMIVSLFEPHVIKGGDRAGDIVPGVVPSRWETTWSEFVATLQETAAVAADPIDKMKSMTLSCAEFAPGTKRSKSTVLGCDAIGFDFDNKDGADRDAWTFDALVAFLQQQAVPFVVHTTASSTETEQCLRLFLPMDRRVEPSEFPTVWRAFATWLRSLGDEATKDESRVFFEPRSWAGRYNRFHAGGADLPPVVVDHIVASHLPKVERAPEDIRPLPMLDRELIVVDDITDIDTSPIVSQDALAEALTARQGGRMYRFLCSVAARARLKSILLTERELVMIGEALAARMQRRDKSDIRHDAGNALRFAETMNRESDADWVTKRRVTLPRYW